MRAFREALHAGSDLSLHSRAFLAAKPAKAMGAWLLDLRRQGRVVFQPWSMEVLFVAGVRGIVRFGDVEETLGASSRTVASRLKALCAAGLLVRTIEPGPPVRVGYSLSKHGRATVAAASPLFAHLNLEGVRRGERT